MTRPRSELPLKFYEYISYDSMKTAIYARKSSESEDRQVQSLEDQLKVLKQVASREGMTIVEEYIEAKSAKEAGNRPIFSKMLEDVLKGKVECILVWHINRLSRNSFDGGHVAYLLQMGKLRCIRTPDRTYLPEDSALLLAVETGMATSFIQDLRKAVIRGLQSKASKGWFPGKAPVGYLNNPITREIDIDPERFDLVHQGWNLVRTGQYNMTELLVILRSRGLTIYGKRGKPRQLSRSTLYALLSNTFYTGVFSFDGTIYQGKHTPMVSESEFNEVQRLLGRDVDRRPRENGSALFAGVLRCSTCNCQIVSETKVKSYPRTGRTVSYTYYHCSNARGGCRKAGVREEDLSAAFQAEFDRLILPQPLVMWAQIECLRQCEEETVNSAHGVSNGASRREKLLTRLHRLHEMRLDGELDFDEYDQLKRAISGELKEVEEVIEQTASLQVRIAEYVSKRLDLIKRASEYSNVDDVAKRAMALELGDQHYLNLKTILIHVSPILRKLASVEPPNLSSESLDQGGDRSVSSVWCTFIQDIRSTAEMEVLHREPEI